MKNEQAVITIGKFMKAVGITSLLGLIAILVAAIIRSTGYNMAASPIRPLALILVLLIVAGYIISLIYLYKVANILKLANRLKISPILLVLVAVLSTPILFLISVVIFIVIWNKAQTYLKGV